MQIVYWLTMFLFIWAASLLTAPVAKAEHENDHRYQVRGYVLDQNKSPVAGSPVSIRLDDQVIGTGTTEADGYYRIRLHLHDPDLGKTLQIRTAMGEASVKVSFEPGDKVTIRRHYANFIGGQLIEGRLFWRESAGWLYGAVVVVVAIAITVLFRRPLKRLLKRRRKSPPTSVQRSTTPPKKRKKHRKQRTA